MAIGSSGELDLSSFYGIFEFRIVSVQTDVATRLATLPLEFFHAAGRESTTKRCSRN